MNKSIYLKRILALILAVLMVLLVGCSAVRNLTETPEEQRERELREAAEQALNDAEKAGALDRSNGFFIASGSLMSVDFDYFPDGVVKIPDTVRWIHEEAFLESALLTSVIIPDSVEVIGCGAFGGCVNLKSVAMGTGVTEIDVAAFARCTSLTTITIPDSVKEIGWAAFYACDSLPDEIKQKAYTYSGCANDVLYKGLSIDELLKRTDGSSSLDLVWVAFGPSVNSGFTGGDIEDDNPFFNYDDREYYNEYDSISVYYDARDRINRIESKNPKLFEFNGVTFDKYLLGEDLSDRITEDEDGFVVWLELPGMNVEFHMTNPNGIATKIIIVR